MRMKYTMPPYPNTHVYLYNGRIKIERVGRDEFIEFDETVRRSWENLLWQEGFRPLDEEGNVIMSQSKKAAGTSPDKQSVDSSVLAGNNPEFQKIHAAKLKEFEENAKSVAPEVADEVAPDVVAEAPADDDDDEKPTRRRRKKADDDKE